MISTLAIAQRGHHRASVEQFKTELNLTEAQLDELAEIKAEMQQQFIKMKSSETKPTREDRQALRKAQKEKMMGILTPVQIEKFEALKKAKKEDRVEQFKANKAKFKEARQELKTYHQNEVKPVLAKQRAKLDQEISAEDKKELARIRTLAHAYKVEKKAAFQEKKEARQNERKANVDAKEGKGKGGHHLHRKGRRVGHGGHGFAKGFKEKYPNEAAQLATMEKKYQPSIIALMDEIEDERAEWKDKKETTRKNLKEGLQKKRAGKDCKGEDCDKQKHADKKEARQDRKETAKRIGFLLMDPNNETNNQTATPSNLAIIHNTKVYPNPATTDQTIEFDVAKTGNVLVEIVDKKGKVIQQVHNGSMTEGTQSLNVNIANLKGFVFYYRITDAAGTSSTKFLTKN